MTIIESLGRHPPERVAVRVGALDISYARLMADVMAAAAVLAAKGVAAGSKVGIRAGSVANGHSYANWVAHLASINLGAAHVSIVESASLSAAVQAGVIDLAIGARKSLDDIPPSLGRVEFDCDPARPLATVRDAPPADEASAARINLTSGTTGTPKFLVWDRKMIEARFHFAHTQPVWIDQIGSIEPKAARAAANDLLKALTYSENKFAQAYGATVPPGLTARIAEARRRLTEIAAE